MSAAWTATETVTVVHFDARDVYGEKAESGREEVADVLLAPAPARVAEERATVGRNVVTVDLVAYVFRPDVPISATDQIIRTRYGTEIYEVVGEPGRWESAAAWGLTGAEISLRKVTG